MCLDLIWITHSSDNPQWRKERDIVASVSVMSLWSAAAESLLLSTWMRCTSNKLAFYVSLRNCLPSTHISTRVPAVQYPWKPYIPLIMHLNPWSVWRFCSKQSFHVGGVVTEPSRMTPFSPFTFPAAVKWQFQHCSRFPLLWSNSYSCFCLCLFLFVMWLFIAIRRSALFVKRAVRSFSFERKPAKPLDPWFLWWFANKVCNASSPTTWIRKVTCAHPEPSTAVWMDPCTNLYDRHNSACPRSGITLKHFVGLFWGKLYETSLFLPLVTKTQTSKVYCLESRTFCDSRMHHICV